MQKGQGEILIRRATRRDIPIVEEILLDAVNWLIEVDQPLWDAEEVRWMNLSRQHDVSDFYLTVIDGEPCGCAAITDYDPFVWPDLEKGESLFIHKLAVRKTARKSGAADALINHAKSLCRRRGICAVRLDCHQFRPRLREFYERRGFVCVCEKLFLERYDMAYYVCHIN
jgi:GNAT superfamily N-acetyltransferase